MKVKAILLIILSFTSLLFSSPSMAQQNIIDVFEMDIETLLNVKVFAASKRDESIIEAPGIVTVITKEDIKHYGGNSLMDIISRLPNVDINRIPIMLTGMGANIRGQSPEGTINHTLTLIDGRPFRDSQVGWDQALYQSFPLEAIEKIEMIRGPGSVLYGTNAFSGVINIITKKPDRNKPAQTTYLSAGYGSFNTKSADMSYRMYDTEKDLSLSAAIKYFDSQGWDYEQVDIFGVFDETDLAKDALGGIARMQFKNLTITGFTGRTEAGSFGAAAIWPIGVHRQDRHFLDIGYKQPLGDKWKANFNVTYNSFENSVFTPGTLHDDNEFNDILYEVSLSGFINENLNVIAGAVYDDREGSLKPGNMHFDEAMENYYLQVDYTPLSRLKLIGGLQLNRPENFESYDISLRGGAIINFTPEMGAKLLYGEAFRAPAAAETSLNIPGLTGNMDLKSEEITTKEAQVFYNTSRYFAAATYYESLAKNPIFTGPNPAPPPSFTFLNGDKLEYKGIELEGKAHLSEKFEFQGSLAYQWGKNPGTGNDNITLAPHFMFKAGASYIFEDIFTIGVFNQHIGDTIGYPTIVLPTAKSNPTVDNTNLLTANISLNLNRVFGLPHATPDFSFNIYGDNLLDEDIHVPEVSDGIANNTIPGHGGRAIYTRLSVRF